MRNALRCMTLLLALVISSGFYGCEKQQGPTEKPTIKIGAALALSGDLAFIGEAMKNAFVLAKEELGDSKYNFELVFGDDQLDPKLTASVVQKLINVDKVDAVISVDSGPGNVTNPIATKHNVLHFGMGLSPGIYKGETNFVHWTQPEPQNELLLQELKKRGYKRIGLIRSRYLDCDVLAEDLYKRIAKYGIEIVTDQQFNLGEKDFRSLIAKAKEPDPDIYLLWTMSPELELITKQMREAGIKTPLTTTVCFETTPEVGLFEGYWYIGTAEPSNAFIDAYKARFNIAPAICAGNSYDIFNLIVAALKDIDSTKKPTTQEIARALMKIKNFKGALGNLSIDEDGVVHSAAKLKMVKDGKFIEI